LGLRGSGEKKKLREKKKKKKVRNQRKHSYNSFNLQPFHNSNFTS
jgi:hypothetical protein